MISEYKKELYAKYKDRQPYYYRSISHLTIWIIYLFLLFKTAENIGINWAALIAIPLFYLNIVVIFFLALIVESVTDKFHDYKDEDAS